MKKHAITMEIAEKERQLRIERHRELRQKVKALDKDVPVARLIGASCHLRRVLVGYLKHAVSRRAWPDDIEGEYFEVVLETLFGEEDAQTAREIIEEVKR